MCNQPGMAHHAREGACMHGRQGMHAPVWSICSPRPTCPCFSVWAYKSNKISCRCGSAASAVPAATVAHSSPFVTRGADACCSCCASASRSSCRALGPPGVSGAARMASVCSRLMCRQLRNLACCAVSRSRAHAAELAWRRRCLQLLQLTMRVQRDSFTQLHARLRTEACWLALQAVVKARGRTWCLFADCKCQLSVSRCKVSTATVGCCNSASPCSTVA